MASTTPSPVENAYERMNDRLDEIQNSLPSVPARMMAAQRKMTCAAMTMAQRNAERVKSAFDAVTKTGETATNTVTGQARAAADDIARTTTTAAKTVAGQARAQAMKVGEVISDQAGDVASDVADDLDTVADAAMRGAEAAADEMADDAPSPDHGYETWTREELYARAKDLDVSGRSTMTKDELIAALRNAR